MRQRSTVTKVYFFFVMKKLFIDLSVLLLRYFLEYLVSLHVISHSSLRTQYTPSDKLQYIHYFVREA